MTVRYEIVELTGEDTPVLDTPERCEEFFESIGTYGLLLARENDDGIPVLAILPIDAL